MLKGSLNSPGSVYFTAEDAEWRIALGNAFWWARLRGYFPRYRVSADGTEIVNIDDEDVELDPQLQFVIVLMATLNALEARLASTATNRRAKAGPVESEVSQLASVLVELIRQRRRELETIRDEIVASDGATAAYVLDGFLARQGGYACGATSYWLN